VKVLILVVVLAAVVGGVLYLNSQQPAAGGTGGIAADDETRTVTTEKARSGTITAKASAPARVISRKTVDLFATVAGTVTKIDATEGEAVEAGKNLFTLQNPKLESDVVLAQVRMESAKAELDEAETTLENQKKARSSKEQEAESRRLKAEAALAAVQAKGGQYEADIEGNQRSYTRLKEAFDRGPYVQAKEVEDVRTALERAKAQKASWEKEVEQQAATNAADEASFQQDLLRIDRDVSNAESKVKTSQKKVEEQQKNLEVAQKELEKTKVASPIAGIAWDIKVVVGEQVTPGSLQSTAAVLATIADMSEVLVEADVDETDVYAIKVGLKAQVRIESVGGDQRWTGTVVEIAPSGEKSKTSDIFLFKTKVKLEGAGDLAGKLRPGIGAQVEIDTKTESNAVLVPAQAVVQRALSELPKELADEARKNAGGARIERAQVVFVVEGGTVRAKLVSVGLSDTDSAQILDGVSSGDEVVTGDSRALERLRHGETVKVR